MDDGLAFHHQFSPVFVKSGEGRTECFRSRFVMLLITAAASRYNKNTSHTEIASSSLQGAANRQGNGVDTNMKDTAVILCIMQLW